MEREKLPRHYWPIMAVWLMLGGALGAAAGMQLRVSPYLSAALMVCFLLMVEVSRYRSR